MLASRGTAGDYKASNSAVVSKLLPGGPKGYDAIKEYARATNNSPEAQLSLHHAFAESLRDKTIGDDGMVDPAKLARWQETHKHGLRAMDELSPGFSNRFDDAVKASQTVLATAAAHKAMRDHFQAGLVGKLLGADGEDEIINRFGRIMNSDDRESQINKLVNTARSSPEAYQGVRKIAAAWMARQFKTQTEIGATGERQVSGDAFRKILADKVPVLRKMYSTAEIDNFYRIAATLDMQNRSILSKLSGSPGTAQDLHQAAKGHGAHGSAPATSLREAVKSGAMLGYMAHGWHGAGWGAATGGAGHIVNTLRAMGVDNIQKLYTDALLNPEMARTLVGKVPEAPQKPWAQAIASNLRRSILTAPIALKAVQQQNGRAAGGRVEPTDAQKEAGNYRKDHVRLAGMDISIENRKGEQRTGIGKNGKRWAVRMPAHYGYIRGTTGADGDHVDCYVGPHDAASHAYIVDQHDAETGKFDEHKVMLGFPTERDALQTYADGFSDGKGPDRIGAVTKIPTGDVFAWAKSEASTKPAADHRAKGGRVGGAGPLGFPTFGNVLAPAQIAVSRGFGFANGGPVHPVDEILASLRQRDPVERAMSVARDMVNRERRHA